jgi:hypothetical protein
LNNVYYAKAHQKEEHTTDSFRNRTVTQHRNQKRQHVSKDTWQENQCKEREATKSSRQWQNALSAINSPHPGTRRPSKEILTIILTVSELNARSATGNVRRKCYTVAAGM